MSRDATKNALALLRKGEPIILRRDKYGKLLLLSHHESHLSPECSNRFIGYAYPDIFFNREGCLDKPDDTLVDPPSET